MTPCQGTTFLFNFYHQLPRLSCVASGTAEVPGHCQEQLT